MAAPQYRVTLHIYSGREDPSWIIPGDHQHLSKIAEHLGGIQGVGQLSSRLGYKGFTIHRKHGEEEREYVCPAAAHEDLEDKILQTAGALLSAETMKYVREASPVHAPVSVTVAAPKPGNPTEPQYDPAKWNYDPNTRLNNNCYNYGNNMITNTFAQPGKASGHPVPETGMSGDAYKTAAEYDGLKSVPAGIDVPSTKDENHLVALVFKNTSPKDFHWYRRAPDGWWSHKPGPTDATDVDNSGNIISDPRTCNRGDYDEFVGFMTTDPSRVKIE